MPTIYEILPEGSLAGRSSILATVQYPGEKPRSIRFYGASTPGHPGPVYYAPIGAMEPHTRVDNPERFGYTFNADWVHAFFTDDEPDPVDWEGHPDTPVSEEELKRLIAEDERNR